jgi:hypothetical protein
MVLGIGRVHPRGETDPAYDGLFYRADEVEGLAAELAGKPLLIEHLSNHPVGRVQRAWVGRDGGVLCVFETNGGTFPGLLAHNLVRKGLTRDLSLGHIVTKDTRVHRVVGKDAVEVSLVERGARPGTHILGVGESGQEKRRYILTHCESSQPPPSMEPTSSTPAMNAPATNAEPTEADSNSVMQELLQQLNQQQTSITTLKARFAEETTRAQDAEAKAERLGRVQKEQREAVINSTLKDYVKSMITSFGDRLKPHSEELQHMLEGMGQSEDSDPIVQLLSCASADRTANVNKLEAAYQSAKKFQTERDAYKAQVDHLRKPAFSGTAERFRAPKQAAPDRKRSRDTTDDAAWTPAMPSGMQPVQPQRDGMQLRNPAFWKKLRGPSGRVGSGMGTFEEPNLVGKDYHADNRRPSALPQQ